MSAELLHFTGVTKLDLPAETVLDRAAEAGLRSVLVIGWAGDDLYATATTSNVGHVLELVEMFKHKLLSGEYGK